MPLKYYLLYTPDLIVCSNSERQTKTSSKLVQKKKQPFPFTVTGQKLCIVQSVFKVSIVNIRYLKLQSYKQTHLKHYKTIPKQIKL